MVHCSKAERKEPLDTNSICNKKYPSGMKKTFSMKENHKNLSVANLHLMCMAKGSLLNRKEILTEGT